MIHATKNEKAAAHKGFMQRALDIARLGNTSPNPMVGCVIVKNGKIISEGYHKQAGKDHAEIAALKKIGNEAKNAIMYVTLEPCSHYGKTPPCIDPVLGSGIKEIFIAMKDPNRKVNGKSIMELKKKGVKVNVGLLENEAKCLNEVYIKYITKKVPYVVLKFAVTLDGKIAHKKKTVNYISNEKSRKIVHELRDRVDAVLVGINTIINDDPLLTTRLKNKKGRDPLRIILDQDLKIPLKAKVLKDSNYLIAVSSKADKTKASKLNTITCKSQDGIIDLKDLLQKLGKMEISYLLVEGGAKVGTSFLEKNLVDRMMLFITPKKFGKGGIDMLSGPKRSFGMKDIKITKVGGDLLVVGTPVLH